MYNHKNRSRRVYSTRQQVKPNLVWVTTVASHVEQAQDVRNCVLQCIDPADWESSAAIIPRVRLERVLFCVRRVSTGGGSAPGAFWTSGGLGALVIADANDSVLMTVDTTLNHPVLDSDQFPLWCHNNPKILKWWQWNMYGDVLSDPGGENEELFGNTAQPFNSFDGLFDIRPKRWLTRDEQLVCVTSPDYLQHTSSVTIFIRMLLRTGVR